jgi:hypothetical protein
MQLIEHPLRNRRGVNADMPEPIELVECWGQLPDFGLIHMMDQNSHVIQIMGWSNHPIPLIFSNALVEFCLSRYCIPCWSKPNNFETSNTAEKYSKQKHNQKDRPKLELHR